MAKDNKARYGSKMSWWRQKKKQAAAGKNRDERLHGEVINEEDDSQ